MHRLTALLLLPAFLPLSTFEYPSPALLASTPPMGWNSWDSYGLTVTESEFKANADWVAQNLKQHGWQYVVIDEGWYLQNPEAKPGGFHFLIDGIGRYIPATNRFPSGADGTGFQTLAAQIHSMGLKFGIHIVRGIPKQAVVQNLPIADSPYHAADAADQSDTCPWNADNYGVKASPAGQAYYDSVAKLYAAWGVDFVKVDCIASHPYKADEIRMFSEALRKTGHPIVLSLSPGPAPLDKADELARYAQMWRISDDIWDHWGPWPGHESSPGVRDQFAVAAAWAPHVAAGHWPDADMLPIGYLGPRTDGPARQTRLTHDEQRTILTLWSIFRSPLIMGGNLTHNDAWTTALLTNDEVIAVDQHSVGGHAALNNRNQAVWVARSETAGSAYVGLANLADTPQTIEYPLQPLGLSGTAFLVRDLWQRKDLGRMDKLSITLPPHASALYKVTVPERLR